MFSDIWIFDMLVRGQLIVVMLYIEITESIEIYITQIRDLTVFLSYNSKSSCACMQLIGLLISSRDLWSMYFVEKGESYAAYKYNFDLWYRWSWHRFLFSSSIEPFTTFFLRLTVVPGQLEISKTNSLRYMSLFTKKQVGTREPYPSRLE